MDEGGIGQGAVSYGNCELSSRSENYIKTFIKQ